MTEPQETRQETLAHLLGGRRGALDATLPPIGFLAGYLIGGESVGVGVAVALGLSVAVAAWRIVRGERPRAVVLGVLGVAVAAIIALRTGRAADFFVLRIATNAASAAAWLASIAIRWPLLGVVVGLVLGQGGRWRRDPVLVRAYGRGSWVWVLQYLIRVAVLLPLWYADQVVALGVAQAALTWPLVALCLVVSWWVVRAALPPDHPGLRHPVLPTQEPAAPG
jgi:Protein of unknown function (DUF3159)